MNKLSDVVTTSEEKNSSQSLLASQALDDIAVSSSTALTSLPEEIRLRLFSTRLLFFTDLQIHPLLTRDGYSGPLQTFIIPHMCSVAKPTLTNPRAGEKRLL